VPRLTVLADDLSGALETAARLSPDAVVLRPGAAAPDAAVGTLVVDTDSRSLTPEAAAARVREALAVLRGRGGVFAKKIDSQLRGNIAAELRATVGPGGLAADAPSGDERPRGGAPLVVLTSAAPGLGRTVEGGRPLIDGAPLAHSPAWAREGGGAPGRLAEVLGGLSSAELPLRELRSLGTPAALAARLRELSATVRAVTADAATGDDLRLIGAACAVLGPEVLLTGTAEALDSLAAAMSGAGDPGGGATLAGAAPAARRRVAVVVGTPEPAAAAQVERLAEAGVPVVRVDPRVDDVVGLLAALERTSTEPLGAEESIVAIVCEPRSPIEDRPGFARLLAGAVRPAVERDHLVLTGGETAGWMLEGLGLRRLSAPAPVLDADGGPVAGTVSALADGGRIVATKPGSFGGPEALLLAARAVAARAATSPGTSAAP